MKRAFLVSFLVAAAAPAFALDYPNGLSPDGIGNIKIGMSSDRLEAVLHQSTGYSQYTNHGCSILTTPALEPSGISLMIEKKVLTRINLDYVGKSEIPATIKTDTGVGLGSTEEEVKKAYPNAKVKVNPADPTWHTIIDETTDHAKGIIFETDGKTVKSVRAGANPAISYANGCN